MEVQVVTVTVFLADDHGVVREGLRSLLEAQEDIKVVGEADNGRDATDQVIELRPDVAILDVAMPQLNGIEAASRICEQCPSTRIIMLSMHSAHEHIIRALQAGAQAYLLKESAGTEIVDAIRAVLKGHRYLSQRVSDLMIDDYIGTEGRTTSFNPLGVLTTREREILQLVVEGKSSAEIGALLKLSSKSVDTYRSRVMRKLKIKDIPSLVKFAIVTGLISLD
jgi:DNA-binding NarL/FixJ family response regulator